MRVVPQMVGDKLCMLHSMAAVLGTHPNNIKGDVGTSTHWQEYTELIRNAGYIPMFLDFFPTTVACHDGQAIWPLEDCMIKMSKQLFPHKAVLITESHAVVFENGLIYDSVGETKVYPFEWGKYRSAIILIPESNQE